MREFTMTRRALFRALLLSIAVAGPGPLRAQSPPLAVRSGAPWRAQLVLCGGVPHPSNAAEISHSDAELPAPSPAPIAGRPEIPSENLECLPGFSSLADARLCCSVNVNPFARFLSSQSLPLTAKDKFILAEKNIRDPFNLLTVGGEAAVSIGSDSHTAYGPGIPGFAKYAGVSLTQEMVGQFFGTFLIPSLAHQDPYYRRMPNLPVKRRVLHVFDAVLISESDEGQRMFNYATVFGTIGTSALGNVYVPGRETNWGASAERVAISLATYPIGNAVAEFLPDVARRINVNVLLVQRVINRVAIEEGAAPAQ